MKNNDDDAVFEPRKATPEEEEAYRKVKERRARLEEAAKSIFVGSGSHKVWRDTLTADVVEIAGFHLHEDVEGEEHVCVRYTRIDGPGYTRAINEGSIFRSLIIGQWLLRFEPVIKTEIYVPLLDV